MSSAKWHLFRLGLNVLILYKINPRKATGFDHIPGKIVRIAHQVLSFLYHTFDKHSNHNECVPF